MLSNIQRGGDVGQCCIYQPHSRRYGLLYRTLNQLHWLDIREWNTVTIRTQIFVLQTLSAPTNAQFCILCVYSVCKVGYLWMLIQFVNQLIMHAMSSMKVIRRCFSSEYCTIYRVFLLSPYRSRRFYRTGLHLPGQHVTAVVLSDKIKEPHFPSYSRKKE